MNVVLMLAALSLYGCARNLEVTAFVKDEVTGEPIANAQIDAYFHNDNGWEAWSRSAPEGRATAQTDAKGMCKLTGSSNKGEVGLAMWEAPNGYYRHPGVSLAFRNTKSLRREWIFTETSVTLSLQRVEHPIPLCVHNVQLSDWKNGIAGFDGTNIVLKFDFIVGDWLPPHGNGRYADMVIRTNYRLNETINDRVWEGLTMYEFASDIEFPNEGNGLVEQSFVDISCGLKFRMAPDSGYIQSKTLRFGRRRKNTNLKMICPDVYTECNKNRCYCFRIRSRFDEKGNLVEAYYGKIYGDFQLDGWDKVGFRGVNFLYYLNPTPLDRNLEWDMKTNLCPNPGMVGRQP